MAYVRTQTLLETLKARLASAKLTGSDQPLFERVEIFGANRLVEAMKATFASEARVCFLIPGGDVHANSTPDSVMVHSRRTTRLAMIIADRSMNKPEALIGGPNSLGILTLKDEVAENLSNTPLPIRGVALVPQEGEPLVIEQEGKAGGNVGRECWLQWFATYAAETSIVIP